MIAHQFQHPEVFSLLMQRSPHWLRLINAAEVGDEAWFHRRISRALLESRALLIRLYERVSRSKPQRITNTKS
jgi:hypothetical protein